MDMQKLIKKYVDVGGLVKEICKHTTNKYNDPKNRIKIGDYDLHIEQILIDIICNNIHTELGLACILEGIEKRKKQ